MDNKLSFKPNGKPVDAYLISSKVNRFYFTKFNSSYGYLILTPNAKIFLTDFRYAEEAQLALKTFGYDFAFCAGNAMLETIYQKLQDLGVKTLAVEDENISYAEYKNIKNVFKNISLVPIGGEILQKRSIKTNEELEKIITAQEICSKVYEKMLSFVKIGMSEIDVAIELEYNLRKAGGGVTAFETIVASGDNTSKPHAKPTMRKIQAGDLVLLDYGITVDGYCSDISRTFAVGKVSDEIKCLYDIVLKSQLYAIDNIKAGMSCREADSYAREMLVANNCGKEFCHSLGHGVGLEVHEFPNVSRASDTILKENMVISIEPGVYLHGKAGVRIEDLVVIKNDKLLNITTASKDFKMI